ncbi:MAG: helix-turn-helix domain-containing protein [Sandaracinus sp.]|nr:helix-turn-helix domain-containing protein [Sandaracinus sp.]MCB9613506.1 helix-turn-helix domain-containing protein [Sandaracinus sp.]
MNVLETDLMTMEAAAARLGVSLATVYRLAQRGEIQTRRLFNRRLAVASSVDALLAARGRT